MKTKKQTTTPLKDSPKRSKDQIDKEINDLNFQINALKLKKDVLEKEQRQGVNLFWDMPQVKDLCQQFSELLDFSSSEEIVVEAVCDISGGSLFINDIIINEPKIEEKIQTSLNKKFDLIKEQLIKIAKDSKLDTDEILYELHERV